MSPEPLHALQSAGKHPDILIAEPGRDPVVIETEFAPAASVENDAKARLRMKTQAGDEIRTAIAVRMPAIWKEIVEDEELERAIETDQLEWAAWSADGDVWTRWPEHGWIRSPVSMLAFAAYQGTLAQHRVRSAARALSDAVVAAGRKIGQLAGAGYGGPLKRIAKALEQRPDEQTWSMAALIIANALAFHEILAGRGNLSHVPSLTALKLQRQDHLRKVDILPAWQQILAVDYYPIFLIASRVLAEIPDAFADPILDRLDEAVTEAGLRTLLPSHDILSETFQRLIADRKALAAFYTLPETAALLAGLALSERRTLNGRSWEDTEALKSGVIGDFACGTGTLLAAAYRRFSWLHEAAGGDAAAQHPHWMAHSLVGVDVLPAAAHLTATILSGVHPMEHYDGSQIHIARYGRHNGQGDPPLGSLDMLDSQLPLMTFVNLAAQIGSKESSLANPAGIPDVDLCIMNPPYTRNTNHEGGRAEDPLPAFAAFGIPEAVQKVMAKRLKTLTKGTFAHGNAGEGSAFLALADRKTIAGGTLAMVLPLTFLMGASWSGARAELAKYYRDLMVITISGLHRKESGFSADTDMAECLLVAKKEVPSGPNRIVMVSLDQRPADALSATLLAEEIGRLAENGIRRLEDAPVGGTEIRLGADHMGTLLSVPASWGPGWVGGRVADFSLAQAVYHMVEEQKAWLPGIELVKAAPVQLTALADLADLGPLDRDINGREKDKDGHPRGPFDVLPNHPGHVPTYPILWEHDAAAEITLEFEADAEGVPRPEADPEELVRVSSTATHLHINRDWRFNSQPLHAQWTDRPTIGGRAWPSLIIHPHAAEDPCGPDRERLQAIALLLWLNSTPGILVRWLWSNRQQHGRGMMTREVIAQMPVLDVRMLTAEQLAKAEVLFKRLRHKPLLPVHKLPQDATRADLDHGLLHEILGWPMDWFEPHHGPLDLLRRKLAAEPTIHGHKKS